MSSPAAPSPALRERWRTEAEHHDREWQDRRVQALDAETFYRTRPLGMRRLLDRIGPLAPGSVVLDVGCGLGHFSRYFRDRGATVLAFDVSRAALRAMAPTASVHRVLAPAERVPVRAGRVDVVWGAAVLHHLDIPTVAREFLRVLRPGGRVMFYEPLGYNPVVNLYRRLTPSRRTPTERPIRLEELRPLEEAFGPIEVTPWHFFAAIPQAIGMTLGLARLPGKAVYQRLQPAEAVLARLDEAVFDVVPAARAWAQSVTITCVKR